MKFKNLFSPKKTRLFIEELEERRSTSPLFLPPPVAAGNSVDITPENSSNQNVQDVVVQKNNLIQGSNTDSSFTTQTLGEGGGNEFTTLAIGEEGPYPFPGESVNSSSPVTDYSEAGGIQITQEETAQISIPGSNPPPEGVSPRPPAITPTDTEGEGGVFPPPKPPENIVIITDEITESTPIPKPPITDYSDFPHPKPPENIQVSNAMEEGVWDPARPTTHMWGEEGGGVLPPNAPSPVNPTDIKAEAVQIPITKTLEESGFMTTLAVGEEAGSPIGIQTVIKGVASGLNLLLRTFLSLFRK